MELSVVIIRGGLVEAPRWGTGWFTVGDGAELKISNMSIDSFPLVQRGGTYDLFRVVVVPSVGGVIGTFNVDADATYNSPSAILVAWSSADHHVRARGTQREPETRSESPRHAARVRYTQREPAARSESPRHAAIARGTQRESEARSRMELAGG